MREEHDRIFAQLQVALLRARTDKLSKIKEAEKQYYFQHKHMPNKDDHSTEYGQLMKDYHYICKLLRKLKVELPSHLQCMCILLINVSRVSARSLLPLLCSLPST